MADKATDRRPVVKWPGGMLGQAQMAAGGRNLSTYVVGCGRAVMTAEDRARVQQMAAALHDLACDKHTRSHKAMLCRKAHEAAGVAADPALLRQAEALEAEVVEYAPASILIPPADLQALGDAASAAGFLRPEDVQPMGRPSECNRSTMGRSFVAFLRAAVAVDLEQRAAELADLAAVEADLASKLGGE